MAKSAVIEAEVIEDVIEEMAEETTEEEMMEVEEATLVEETGLTRVSVLTGDAVNGILGRYNNLLSEAARIKQNADYLAKAKQREAAELLQRFLPNLIAFADSRLEGTANDEIRLLNGVIGYKTKPASFEVLAWKDDEALAWAQQNAPNAIKTGLDKSYLTYRFRVSDTGEVLDTRTGEVLAWAKGKPSEKQFYVK